MEKKTETANMLPRKENQRIALTRRLLLEALLQLLEKKHINDVSVTELCRRAGINRTTFYKHYATPNDVLAEHIEVHVQKLMELQDPKYGKNTQQVLEESCEYIHAHADLFRIFGQSRIDEDFFRKVFLAMIEKSDLQEAARLHSYDESDLKLTISYLASGYYFLIRRWIMEEIPKAPKEIALLLLKLRPTDLIRP